MIRHARDGDLPALRRLGESTGMFFGDELDAFVGELSEHLDAVAKGGSEPATLLVATDGPGEADPVIGAAYYRPEAMAQGVVNLLFIAVLPDRRRRGNGAELLDHFEYDTRRVGARLAVDG